MIGSYASVGILGGIGVPELLVILAIVLILFGPKRLPQLGSSLGKTVKNIREGMEDESGEDEAEYEDEDEEDVEDEEEPEEAPKPKKRKKAATSDAE